METGITGKVKFFAQEKGWGFISRDDGKGDVFVHSNELRRCEIEAVTEGDELEFDVESAEKGKRAKNLSRI